jgi:hypothetical protein
MRNGSETSRRGGTGRRAGLKIQYSQECVGSNPSAGRFFNKTFLLVLVLMLMLMLMLVLVLMLGRRTQLSTA